MERLTMLIDSHLLDNGKLYREYDLNNKIQLNEYSCMDIPNAVYNKLGELEDVLEEFELTSAEDLRNFLNFKGNMAIWEGELNYKNKIADLEQELADLEAKLAESEKSKESYRLQNEQHHLQLLQFYSRLGVEAFGADIHEKALETLMIMKQQLAEKDKEQNQKAIEQLEKIINLFEPYENENKDTILCANNGISFLEYINSQIASLKKGVE